MRSKGLIDAKFKKLLGFEPDSPDKMVLSAWKKAASSVCKPCWELKYCPYGPLVENSPLFPPTQKEAIEYNEYLKTSLKSGKSVDGKPLDGETLKLFRGLVKKFDSTQYAKTIPVAIQASKCNVFGHICPVIFAAEGFTETSEFRRTGRYIPFKTKIRVARRDNYFCQECKKPLLDDELEFDHIIPLSKGGSSEEQNIRLTCYNCNRDKLDKVEL